MKFKDKIINIFAYCIFDTYYWKLRAKKTTPTNELKRFRKAVKLLNDYLDEDLMYYSLKDECKYLGRLSRDEVEKILMTLRFLAEAISRVKHKAFIHIASKLREYVMFMASKELPDSLFKRKAHYFGLLVSNRVNDIDSAIEAIRLSISCLPKGGQYVANLFLYITFKIIKIWKLNVKSMLHLPLDCGISEVFLSLGLVDRRLENLEYLSTHYLVAQKISEIMFPHDPSRTFTLRAVAERWCYGREWKLCEQCWLCNYCPREY